MSDKPWHEENFMDSVNLAVLLPFVFVTTFTPGPNNISSSSMGVLYGYRKTLNYLLGIVTGFLGVMILCAIISGTLYGLFPSLEGVMRLIGAAYILFLAYKTFRASYQFSLEESPVLGFSNGLLLQALNPKGWVHGLTLYSTFLAPITSQWPLLIVSALGLTLVAFCAVSTWTISGAAIRRFINQPNFRHVLNAILALLLVYTAFELSGLF
jgi:cysteine/O-acetylserine efflux protein